MPAFLREMPVEESKSAMTPSGCHGHHSWTGAPRIGALIVVTLCLDRTAPTTMDESFSLVLSLVMMEEVRRRSRLRNPAGLELVVADRREIPKASPTATLRSTLEPLHFPLPPRSTKAHQGNFRRKRPNMSSLSESPTSNSTPTVPAPPLDAEDATRQRYSSAAQAREEALCCPVDYDRTLLEAIPEEVIDRDYGCGDPSRYVRAGETVLDLGSGGGKICFIASQIVGAEGRVIGVDMNDEMLGLARDSAPAVAENIGYANVEFRRGRIQDLALNVDLFESWLNDHPVKSMQDLTRLEEEKERLCREQPLVEDDSVDLIVSNCVLNLVREEEKDQLIEEMYRVLKPGGRIAHSDIVSDEVVPAHLKNDPELWSGCVSGAFQELDFLKRLETAGFHGIEIDKWESEPFAVVEGIEFRSLTVLAKKGKNGPCMEAGHAVLYKGPWKQVMDDDGHTLERGVRTAVCAKTFRLLSSEPYAAQTIGIAPGVAIPEEEQVEFDCDRKEPRHPKETKGADYKLNKPASDPCC
jgi:arsenite methyltransferase